MYFTDRGIEELEQRNVAAEVIAGIERLAAPFT